MLPLVPISIVFAPLPTAAALARAASRSRLAAAGVPDGPLPVRPGARGSLPTLAASMLRVEVVRSSATDRGDGFDVHAHAALIRARSAPGCPDPVCGNLREAFAACDGGWVDAGARVATAAGQAGPMGERPAPAPAAKRSFAGDQPLAPPAAGRVGPRLRLGLLAGLRERDRIGPHDIALVAVHDYDGLRGFELRARLVAGPAWLVRDFVAEADLLTMLEAFLRTRARFFADLAAPPAGASLPVPRAADAAVHAGGDRASGRRPFPAMARVASAPSTLRACPVGLAGDRATSAVLGQSAFRRALAHQWSLLEGGPGTLGRVELRRLACA